MNYRQCIRIHCPRRKRSKPAFTLIELLVVIAILAIMLAMMLPTLHIARERSAMSVCANNLQHIGVAMAHYVMDNSGYLPPTYGTDWAYKQWISENWGWQYEYQANYMFRNLIGTYLGLGDCMPARGGRYEWEQQRRWADAAYSGFKEFRCASGEGKLSLYSPYPYSKTADGRTVYPSNVSNFYTHNTTWLSRPAEGCTSILQRVEDGPFRWTAAPKEQFNKFQYSRGSVPASLFTQPDKAVMIFERWSCNGGQPEPMTFAQPYNAHYKMTAAGVENIGRNLLYVDWHVAMLPWDHNDIKAYDWSAGYTWYWAWDINYDVLWPG